MPRIIKLSVEELENLENGGGVVTAKTINIEKKRFQAFEDYTEECERKEDGDQGTEHQERR